MNNSKEVVWRRHYSVIPTNLSRIICFCSYPIPKGQLVRHRRPNLEYSLPRILKFLCKKRKRRGGSTLQQCKGQQQRSRLSTSLQCHSNQFVENFFPHISDIVGVDLLLTLLDHSLLPIVLCLFLSLSQNKVDIVQLSSVVEF